jgi:hypothetical protein
MKGYHVAGGACVPIPLPAQPRLSCTVAQARIAGDLQQIAQQQKLAAENQVQLAEWSSLGNEGKWDLLKASGKLILGTYAANLEQVQGKMDKIQEAIKTYDSRLSSLSKVNVQNQVATLNALAKETAELRAIRVPFVLKSAADATLNADTAWDVSKNAMHDGFRTAAAADQELADKLNDPSVRDTLLGPPDSDPQQELMNTVLSEGSQEVAKSELGAEEYESFSGPTVRVASFILDASLADLKIYLSAQGAEQGDANAGALARAAGMMQTKYRQDYEARKTCVP